MPLTQPLTELSYIVETEGEADKYHVGEVGIGLDTDALDKFLRRFGSVGLDSLIKALANVIYEVMDYADKMDNPPENKVI